MNKTMSGSAVATAPATRTEVTRRPRFEGCNIGAWLGFKHLMYLMEEAVIEHFRELGFGPQRLYQDFQLGLDILDSHIRITHVVSVDDHVRMTITPAVDRNGVAIFKVQAFLQDTAVPRDMERAAFSGTVRVGLMSDAPASREWPAAIAPYVVSRGEDQSRGRHIAAPLGGRGSKDIDPDLRARLVPVDANAFVWQWRIPYFYCHHSDRLQHSGYLRMMEEVVDLFLADRGLSIRTMLDKHSWIPFVQNARVELLEDALMEETIYTVFTVTDIYKNLLYSASFDCYVERDGALRHTARGQITHGYAGIRSRSDWGLVPFDEPTVAALSGKVTR